AAVALRVDTPGRAVFITCPAERGAVVVALRPPSVRGGVAATDRFSLHLLEAPACGPETIALLRALLERLCGDGSATVLHPVAEDAGLLSAAPRRLAGNPGGADWIDPRLALRLRQLRER